MVPAGGPPRAAGLEDMDGCDPPVCQNAALETARLELAGPPDGLSSLSGLL